MPRKTETGSERSEAARLSTVLQTVVTRKMIQVWRGRGYPLHDTEELKRRLRNQERHVKLPAKANTPSPVIVSDEVIQNRAATISSGTALWHWRDFAEYLIGDVPALLAGMNEAQMRKTLRDIAEQETAHLLEVLPE